MVTVVSTNPEFLLLTPIFGTIALAILTTLLDKAFVYSQYRTPRYVFSIASLGLVVIFSYTLLLFLNMLQNNTIYQYSVTFGGVVRNYFELILFNGTLLLLVLFLSILVTFYSIEYMNHDLNRGEYYFLLLLLVSGMAGVLLAADFLTLYISYELMGLSSYILVAFRKRDPLAIEAAIKYLFMGAVGSVTALMGLTFIYGTVGTLQYQAVKEAFVSLNPALPDIYVLLITIFIVGGFGVKAAIVPFHSWLIDAHPIAPSGISAMLSGLVIKMGVYSIIVTLVITNFLSHRFLTTVLIILALITITLPNVIALRQSDLKRLLAYSSIYNMGFIILAFSLNTYLGFVAALFHMVAHGLMKGLGFLGAGYFLHYERSRELEKLKGTAKRHKLAGLCLTIALFGLLGLPTTIGFLSKLWVILATLTYNESIIAAIIAVIVLLNTVIATGYYAQIVRKMWMEPLATTPKSEEMLTDGAENLSPRKDTEKMPWVMLLPMTVLALVILYYGIFPWDLLNVIQKAALYFYNF